MRRERGLGSAPHDPQLGQLIDGLAGVGAELFDVGESLIGRSRQHDPGRTGGPRQEQGHLPAGYDIVGREDPLRCPLGDPVVRQAVRSRLGEAPLHVPEPGGLGCRTDAGGVLGRMVRLPVHCHSRTDQERAHERNDNDHAPPRTALPTYQHRGHLRTSPDSTW